MKEDEENRGGLHSIKRRQRTEAQVKKEDEET